MPILRLAACGHKGLATSRQMQAGSMHMNTRTSIAFRGPTLIYIDAVVQPSS